MEKIPARHPERNDNAIKQIFTKFLPFWPLFLITGIASCTYFYFKIKFTTPVYETSASVLIKDEKKGQEDSKMEEVLNVFGAKKIVENELEILRSNSVVMDVVKDMKLYAPIQQEKGLMGKQVVSGYFSCPVEIEAAVPELIKPSKKTYFTFSKKDATVSFNGKTYKFNEWIDASWGRIRFVENPRFIASTDPKDANSKFFFNIYDLESSTKVATANLMVVPASKQSSVINITYKDDVPARAEKLIAGVIASYNRSGVSRKNEIARQTLVFIEDRLSHVSRELDSLESGIQKYRDRSGVINISEQSKLYLSNIGNNDRELNQLNMKYAALEEAEKYLQKKASGESMEPLAPSTFNMEDPTLNNLIQKLSAAESQYETLRKSSGENNPKVLALLEEINKTRPSILENIRNQKKNIGAGKSYLQQSSNQYSAMLSGVPRKEKELVEVSRQQNIKNDIYSFLLQKREETAYSMSSILPDCYIVSNPTTGASPISPKKPFLALLALILPVAFSTGVVLIKDLFNQKILYRTHIEKLTRFPILGEVIFEKMDSNIVTEAAPNSFVVEQFRQIRSVLKYHAQPSGVLKRILVTSFIKSEGKSFVATNLAMSLARSGKKVAILEIDLYQPKVSTYLGIENEIDGITDYLQGKRKAEEIIYPSGKHENLFVLPAGHLAEEPAELLVNGKLEVLLNYLDKQFDIIVIDSSPFKPITDALVMAPLCNLVIVTVRHNHTPIKLLERLDEDMDAQHISNIALVFNGIKNRGLGRYSYGYGYGYGYDQKAAYKDYHNRKIKKVS